MTPTLWEMLRLKQCAKLTLIHYMIAPISDPSHMPYAMHHNLGSIRYLSSSVTHVRLLPQNHLDLSKPDAAKEEWDMVDSTLSDGVQGIHLIVDTGRVRPVYSDEALSLLESFLKERLPRACRKGRITITNIKVSLYSCEQVSLHGVRALTDV